MLLWPFRPRDADRSISPAFRWAQSPSAIFLEQKFSHKWDAPATLGCKQDRFSVKNRRISFHAACKDKRKRFHLDIDLFKPLDATVRDLQRVRASCQQSGYHTSIARGALLAYLGWFRQHAQQLGTCPQLSRLWSPLPAHCYPPPTAQPPLCS